MSNIESLKYHYSRLLTEMKDSNDRAQKTLDLRRQLADDIAYCSKVLSTSKSLNEGLQGKNLTYINEIVQTIEDAVTFAINSVLPVKKYKVKLDYVPYRNNGTLKLYFINENGVKLPPKIIEGDMLNQVLSFSSITHITHQMGYTKVFYDEAFASANVRSLTLINSVIRYYNSLGISFIFVSQNPILYAGLDRMMIDLISDNKQVVEVKQKKVEPTQEEFETVERVIDLFDDITKTEE